MPGQAFRPNRALLAAGVEPKKGKESQPKRLDGTQAPSDGHAHLQEFHRHNAPYADHLSLG
jgi:hypothetical protein